MSESKVSKALYRLLELKELLEDSKDNLPESFPLHDAFGNNHTVTLDHIIGVLSELIEETCPRLEKGGIMSEWDSLQADREKLERMQDVAIGLLDFIPLDRFRQDDLVKLIYKSDQETCKYIKNLPVVAGLQPHLF